MLNEFETIFFRVWKFKPSIQMVGFRMEIMFCVEKPRKRRKTTQICLMNDAMLGRTNACSAW